MSERTYTVCCLWDPEVIPELLEANGLISNTDPGDVRFDVIAERHERAPRAV